MGGRLWIVANAAVVFAIGGVASAQSEFPNSSHEAFDKKMHDDYDKLGPSIRAAGIKAE